MDTKRGIRPITHTEHERGNTVAQTKVRTTITPGEVIKVAEHELVDLERQGLIHSREGDDRWQDDKPVKTESGDITDGLAKQAATGDKPAVAKAKASAKVTDNTKGV